MRLIGIILAMALASAMQAREIPEDPPLASQPTSGPVTGAISPAKNVRQVYAVCRATGVEYKPDNFDAATGKFTFARLPGDAAYDIGVLTADGRRIEGIDLSWHEQRMLRLVRLRAAQLGLPAEKPREFTQADVDEMLAYVRDVRDFTDQRRVLYLRGDGLRATMLVEPMRTTDFYAKKGNEIIWRMELWYFEFRHGGWERVANVERVLRRERIAYDKWQAIGVEYYPELSAYVDEHGRGEPVKFTLPDKPDPSRGRPAKTEPKLQTQPHVLGLATTATTTSGPKH